MIENNEPSSKKMFSPKITKERPELINEDNDIITMDKNKRLLKEEKIRAYQKNQKKINCS